jgi:hypothetical protein
MEQAGNVRIYWGGNYFADYLPASMVGFIGKNEWVEILLMVN